MKYKKHRAGALNFYSFCLRWRAMGKEKDYTDWMLVKTKINNVPLRPTFREGEVYWACVGENVGFEQDGKGRLFARPVIVLKKFNRELFLGIPLTSNDKLGKYYYSFHFKGRKSTAILSQIKAIDSARISGNRIGTVGSKTFWDIRKRLKNFF